MRLKIHWLYDGWYVTTEDGAELGKWDHNDEDMGTKGLKSVLEHLGHEVEVVEEC